MCNSNHLDYEIETSPKNTIHFEEGLLGFEDVKEYLLYHEDDNNMIWSLQAANADFPSFIVVDPFTIFNDYQPVLSKADSEYFGKAEDSDLCFLVVAVIKPELTESVCNLKAPIVIDVNTRKARQIIMDDSNYPIRYKMFQNKE